MVLIIISVIAALVAMVFFWSIMTYNRFVSLKSLFQEAWSGIDVQLKRRYDLIPNLVATVEGYSTHERTVFERVTQMRSTAMHAHGVQEKAIAEAGLTSALKTLFAVAENYPTLRANENFLSLQKQLSTIEDDLQYARRYYNGTVRNFNILVATFPSRIIAFLGGFEQQPYFEIGSVEQREAPRVSFK